MFFELLGVRPPYTESKMCLAVSEAGDRVPKTVELSVPTFLTSRNAGSGVEFNGFSSTVAMGVIFQ
jgi:hypothetical protein